MEDGDRSATSGARVVCGTGPAPGPGGLGGFLAIPGPPGQEHNLFAERDGGVPRANATQQDSKHETKQY